MELSQGAHKASKFAPEDFISNMPDNVVTNILDRLPLQHAVRTSILSRNWRFNWTMLSQLVFDVEFFDYLTKIDQVENYERIISRLLLNLKGAITKFVLYIDEEYNDEEIAHWILFLSRKGVKDLNIFNRSCEPLGVATHLFSCLELKHLMLIYCHFDPPASFHGFPHLSSLELCDAEFESGKVDEFITQCPMLENLCITCCLGNVKLVEIAKCTNLKSLSLSLCNLDNIVITSSSSIFYLVGVLPKLQELMLDFKVFEFTEDGPKKRSPTTLPCLKTLKLTNIDLQGGIMLSFAFDIIWSSLNLHTLEITLCEPGADPPPAICSPEVDCNTMGLLQIRSVVLTNLQASKNEACLIEYLLACSPLLKEVVIHPHLTLGSYKKLMFAIKLLELHRASPVAEIKLKIMIQILGTRNSSKFTTDDFISNMPPEIVVTNILDRLLLQDAARTGVLSTNWRFKWIMLSQLIFNDEFFEYLYKNEKDYDEKYKMLTDL